MDEKIKLGNRIKKMRINKKLTRIDLALIASVNYTTLMNIENGKTNPKLETLIRISTYLDVKLREIFSFDDE